LIAFFNKQSTVQLTHREIGVLNSIGEHYVQEKVSARKSLFKSQNYCLQTHAGHRYITLFFLPLAYVRIAITLVYDHYHAMTTYAQQTETEQLILQKL